MIAFITGMAAVIAGVVIAVLVVVVVIAVVMGGKRSEPPAGDAPAPKPVEDPPGIGNAGAFSAASVSSPPVTTTREESEHQAAPREEPAKPPTLEVEALSPSTTGEAPMLGAETGEMKMATDELPRMGTSEVPQLDDNEPATYRTQAAKDLSQAITSGDCPKCKAPTFVGSEDAEEVGADGTAMFKLTGRCGACGHRAELIDMKVG